MRRVAAVIKILLLGIAVGVTAGLCIFIALHRFRNNSYTIASYFLLLCILSNLAAKLAQSFFKENSSQP